MVACLAAAASRVYDTRILALSSWEQRMEDFDDIAKARWDETQSTPEQIIARFEGRHKQIGEAVLALSPGRELNILVAKYVMGHNVVSDALLGELEGMKSVKGSIVWDSVQPYSEDIQTAELVVDKMMDEGHLDALSWHEYGNGRYTPPEAICKRAFIRKVFGKKR